MLDFDLALCHSLEIAPLLQNGAARICELGTPNDRYLFFSLSRWSSARPGISLIIWPYDVD